jgi:hypothetical protein
MLGLLSYKSLGQMQQSRELLQQSLAAVPLRSPFRIHVEKSVAYLETMILHCRSIRLATQFWCIDGGQFFADHNCGPAKEPGSERKMAPNRP